MRKKGQKVWRELKKFVYLQRQDECLDYPVNM